MSECCYARMSYMLALVSRRKPEVLSNGWHAAGESNCAAGRGIDDSVFDGKAKRSPPKRATKKHIRNKNNSDLFVTYVPFLWLIDELTATLEKYRVAPDTF
jgi:hypothetical protein